MICGVAVSELATRACSSYYIVNLCGFHVVKCDSTARERGTRWRSWLRLCATNRNVADSIPDGVIALT